MFRILLKDIESYLEIFTIHFLLFWVSFMKEYSNKIHSTIPKKLLWDMLKQNRKREFITNGMKLKQKFANFTTFCQNCWSKEMFLHCKFSDLKFNKRGFKTILTFVFTIFIILSYFKFFFFSISRVIWITLKFQFWAFTKIEQVFRKMKSNKKHRMRLLLAVAIIAWWGELFKVHLDSRPKCSFSCANFDWTWL